MFGHVPLDHATHDTRSHKSPAFQKSHLFDSPYRNIDKSMITSSNLSFPTSCWQIVHFNIFLWQKMDESDFDNISGGEEDVGEPELDPNDPKNAFIILEQQFTKVKVSMVPTSVELTSVLVLLYLSLLDFSSKSRLPQLSVGRLQFITDLSLRSVAYLNLLDLSPKSPTPKFVVASNCSRLASVVADFSLRT